MKKTLSLSTGIFLLCVSLTTEAAAETVQQMVVRHVSAMKAAKLEGRLEDAKAQAQMLHQSLVRLGGPETPAALEALIFVADLSMETGDVAAADRIYHNIMAVLRKHGALGTGSDALVTGRIGMLRLAQNKVGEAHEAIQRSLRLMEKLGTARTHVNYTMVLDALCSVYEAQGKYAEYSQTTAKLVGLCKQRESGSYDHMYAIVRHARALIIETRLQEAVDELLAAKTLAEKLNASAALGAIMYQLGRVAAMANDPVNAEKLLRQAQAYFTQGRGNAVVDADIHQHLAMVCIYNGKADEAEKFANALAQVPDSMQGAKLRRAQAYSLLAGVEATRQNVDKARHWAGLAVTKAEEALGKTHPELATFLFNLADLFNVLSDTALSLPMADRALAIRKDQLKPDNSLTAVSRCQVAQILIDLNRDESAARLLEEAEPVLTKSLGKLHMRTLQCRLAGGLVALKLRPDADGAREALKIADGMLKDLPADAPPGNRESVLSLVAMAHLRLGNTEKAAETAEEVCASQSGRLSAEAAAINPSNRIRVNTLLRAGRHEGARAAYQAWSDGLNQLVNKVALSMNARQLGQLKSTDGVFAPPVLLEDGPLLFQAIQRYKGMFVRLIEHERGLFNAAAQNAGTRTMAEKINSLSSDLRRLWLQQTADAGATAQLTRQVEQATQDLLDKLQAPDLNRQELAPEELTKHLPPEGALVDIVRCSVDLEASQPGQRYAAVVLRPGQPVRFVAIGEAAGIEDAWTHYLHLTETFGNAEDPSMVTPAVLSNFDQANQDLYNKAVRPLFDACGDAREIFLVADGVYHQIPIGGLRDEQGAFVCETRFVRALTQSSDLANAAKPMVADAKAVILGGIDYQHSAGGTQATRAATSDSSLTKGVIPTGINFAYDWSLPGASKEAAEVHAVLTRHGMNSETLSGAEATEGALRGLHSPAVLHLATHAHALPPRKPSLLPAHEPESLMTSDLWLAGALNTFRAWEKGAPPRLAGDGVLLAGEAAELNLHETQLVTLSACSSGSGEARGGIGLYGLKQAFFNAGAQSVLATHWLLSDDGTVEVMKLFYEELLALQDPARALHEVQKKLLLQRRRESNVLVATYLTAPFTITSRTVPARGR